MSLRRTRAPELALGNQSLQIKKEKPNSMVSRQVVGTLAAGVLLFTFGQNLINTLQEKDQSSKEVACSLERLDTTRPVVQLTKIVQDLISSKKANDGKQEYKYLCPCCGWQGNEFNPLLGKKNRRCPVCKSLERHRRVCAILGAGQRRGRGGAWLAPPPQNKNAGIPFRLVHFGPEKQMEHVLNFAEGIDQVSLDYLNPHYKYSKNVMHADVTDIPLPTNFANGVIILHVLEHISDIKIALSELKRIMKGWMLVEVPCRHLEGGQHKDCRGNMTKQERRKCAGQWDHVWIYDCELFLRDLQKSGLDCYEIDNKDFGEFEPLLPSCNCNGGTPLYACTVAANEKEQM